VILFFPADVLERQRALTTNLALVIWMAVGFVDVMPPYWGPQLILVHYSQFLFLPLQKSSFSKKWILAKMLYS
jgi:hypothetical protein